MAQFHPGHVHRGDDARADGGLRTGQTAFTRASMHALGSPPLVHKRNTRVSLAARTSTVPSPLAASSPSRRSHLCVFTLVQLHVHARTSIACTHTRVRTHTSATTHVRVVVTALAGKPHSSAADAHI